MPPKTQPDASQNGSVQTTSEPALRFSTGKIASIGKGEFLAELTEQQWRQWAKHHRQQKSLVPLAKLTGTKGLEALCWELPDAVSANETAQLAQILGGRGKRLRGADKATARAAIESWLAEHGGPDISVRRDWYFGIECLILAHACAALTADLDQRIFGELLTLLITLTHEAEGENAESNPLVGQLLGGELPLTLAYLFPEIEACRDLAKPARKALSAGVSRLIDGSGEIEGLHLPVARGLLACWTRSAAVAGGFDFAAFDKDALVLLQWFVHNAIAISRADGTQMLGASGASANRKLMTNGVEQFGSATEKKLAKSALPSKNGPKVARGVKALAPPATHSEWACSALLRSSWRIDSPRLLIDYSSAQIRTELCVADRVLWSGDCSPVIRVDGQLLDIESPWSEVCWHSDADVDYVEFEAVFGAGWKCQRQFLLDRKDRFLFVADALLGTKSGDVEYSCTWPLASRIQVIHEKETTECSLADGKKKVARALPLALPEWKCDGRRSGSLESDDAGLRYRLRQNGERFYAPLAMDLDPDRVKYPYTWRKLSVGRELAHVPPTEAVGYRIQFRLDQWLVYRSLSQLASRTLLGQNYYHEFVCGRFDRFGDVEPLVEVE